MAERRTFWLGKKEEQEAQQRQQGLTPELPSSGLSVLDLMRPPKKKRSREWDKANRAYHYRGVPQEIREEVSDVAAMLKVPTCEVARAFVEYSLMCVKRGTLTIKPLYPRNQHMTLYPFSGAGWVENGWTPRPPKIEKRKRGKDRDKARKPWQEEVAYRFPATLHEEIKALAGNTLPIGEVLTVLLKHGLEGFKSGVLVLNPVIETGVKLTWSGEEK